jgi:hypothetical protein
VVSKWAFQKTEIGSKFYDGLGSKSASESVEAFRSGFRGALQSFLEDKLQKGAEDLCGGKIAGLQIVKEIMKAMAKKITRTVRQFTTIEPLLKSTVKMFELRSTLEEEIAKNFADKAAAEASVNKISGEMWKCMPQIALTLYKETDDLKKDVTYEFREECDEAVQPLTDVADSLYTLQIRIVNAVRATFTESLKAKIQAGQAADENSARNLVRSEFRDAVFAHLQPLVLEAWSQFAAALNTSAQASVWDSFLKNFWPALEKPLEALQEMIPKPLASAGLQIPALAQTICGILLKKGVAAVMTKIFLALEKIMFTQA